MTLNHWNKEEVLAFGDGENDVSMFEVVQYGFAMGQAQQYVKEKAYQTTLTNNEQGIYEMLKTFHLIE